jgi:omega-6 fatty acid desaturase (delta-12 desaturase)
MGIVERGLSLADPSLVASSVLFTKGQRRAVIISNLGLFVMVCAVREAVVMYGAKSVIKYYGIPWLAVTHWCE